MSSGATLEIGDRKISVTNLDKIFYPKTGFTKGNVIDYYVKVSPTLLPHLKNRPISLKRYPNGVEGFFFYEKQCPSHRPQWMKTTRVPKTKGGEINYCVINDLPALIWIANAADLELHTFLHHMPALHRPTVLVFDLDPGPPANIINCCQAGQWLKDIFDAAGMQSFPKTSGSKGLQIYIPLNTPVTYEKTKEFALATAQLLEHRFPQSVVSKMQKILRKGKVFVDWSQNDEKKTTVTAYSLRAKERPAVSTPVTWEEIEQTLAQKKPELLVFEAGDVLKRIEKNGDLFSPILTLKQKLPSLNFLQTVFNER